MADASDVVWNCMPNCCSYCAFARCSSMLIRANGVRYALCDDLSKGVCGGMLSARFQMVIVEFSSFGLVSVVLIIVASRSWRSQSVYVGVVVDEF